MALPEDSLIVGRAGRWRTRDPAAPATPLLTAAYNLDGRTLNFFSTIATFGTPHDVTLDELRIECAFPADKETEQFCRALAARSRRSAR